MKKIYLITGVMASGKSTIAQLLASQIDRCVHLRGDAFRRMIVSGREEMSAEPSGEAVRQLHMRYELTAAAAKLYFEHDFSVVIQDNYYGKEYPRMLELLSDQLVCPVVLCPSLETAKERERGRNKTGYTGFSADALYAAFMAETPRVGLWLDTTGQTPQQSAEAILRFYDPREEGLI